MKSTKIYWLLGSASIMLVGWGLLMPKSTTVAPPVASEVVTADLVQKSNDAVSATEPVVAEVVTAPAETNEVASVTNTVAPVVRTFTVKIQPRLATGPVAGQ